MGKKAPPDPEKYFKNLGKINNLANDSEPEPVSESAPSASAGLAPMPVASPVTVLNVPDTAKNVVVRPPVVSKRNSEKMATDELLEQKGFYISSQQFKMIAHRAVEEGVDRSTIVRAAIDAYFLK